MYAIKYSHANQNFKIKSKQDAKTFLTEMFKGEMCLKLSDTHCVFIRKGWKENEPFQVSQKFGNLKDIFNPELVLNEKDAISLIYQFRKYINSRLFND